MWWPFVCCGVAGKCLQLAAREFTLPFLMGKPEANWIVDPNPHLTARDVARRIAPTLDSDEVARTAQRVKHYVWDGLISHQGAGGTAPADIAATAIIRSIMPPLSKK